MNQLPGTPTYGDNGGLILALPQIPIPGAFRFAGQRWCAKDEYHVTLVDDSYAIPRDMLQAACEGLTFTVTLRNEVWRLVKDRRSTLVVMVDCGNAGLVFRRLSPDFVRPPLHVTFATLDDSGSRRGIGLKTEEDLVQYGTPILMRDLPPHIRF